MKNEKKERIMFIFWVFGKLILYCNMSGMVLFLVGTVVSQFDLKSFEETNLKLFIFSLAVSFYRNCLYYSELDAF